MYDELFRKVRQLTEEEAIAFYDSNKWAEWTAEEKARFQIHQQRVCMPFGTFHVALEEAVGFAVFSHMFGDRGTIARLQELLPPLDESRWGV